MTTLDPASPQAAAMAHLLIAVFIVGALVFLLICLWLGVTIARFRAKPGQTEPYQEYGRRNLEIAWTVAPAMVLAILFAFTVKTIFEADPSPSKDAALASTVFAAPSTADPDIVVTGEQWWWSVRYTHSGVITANEIHFPAGKQLLVALESEDVIHNLWLPQLAAKRDLVPGQTNYIWIEADRPGSYFGNCSEFCGTEHAWMRIDAVAQTQLEFDSWQQDQMKPATSPPSGAAADGEKLFLHETCVNCHTITGTQAKGRAGPDLTHFATRHWIGGGVLANDRKNLANWLRDPQAFKPGVHMPNFHLSDTDVAALTAYLETLR